MLSLLCMWPILPVSVDFNSENDMTNLYPEWYLLVFVWHASTRKLQPHLFPSRETQWVQFSGKASVTLQSVV